MNKYITIAAIFLVSFSLFARAKEKEITAMILRRNEIYARKGYTFNSKALLDYFYKYSWYKPKPNKEVSISKSEQESAQLLLGKENELLSDYINFLNRAAFSNVKDTAIFPNANKEYITDEELKNEIFAKTKEIPYRSNDILLTSITIDGIPDNPKFLSSIFSAENGYTKPVHYSKRSNVNLDGEYYTVITECNADGVNKSVCDKSYIIQNYKLLAVYFSVPQTSYQQIWIYLYIKEKPFAIHFLLKQAGIQNQDILLYY